MLGVDRLDMIKGIPQKLLAFEKFLEENPEWRDKVLLVQIAVPSRTDVPEYQARLFAIPLTQNLSALSQFGCGDWLHGYPHLCFSCLPVRPCYRFPAASMISANIKLSVVQQCRAWPVFHMRLQKIEWLRQMQPCPGLGCKAPHRTFGRTCL